MGEQVTVGREEFGVAAHNPVYLYWLRSPAGLAVAVSTWGASVVHVCAPDRDGVAQEVTLNHSDLHKIMKETSYYGATVGRVASTIAGARYKLGRKEFKLSANINGQHHAHGGFRGFDKQVWHAEVLPPTRTSASVRFSYTSIDGEEGYAGTLASSVVYTVTATNELILEYSATTDKATPINLTNHTYWNLSGDCVRDILGHRLQIFSSKIQKSPIDSAQLVPTWDTPYDFRAGLSEDGTEGGELIGARIAETPDGMGYDTVYVLADPPIDTAVAAEDGAQNSASSAAAGGGEHVSSAPAAATSISKASAEEHGLEPEPEVEPQVDVRRLGSTAMRPAARLVDEASGRVMEVVTNQPCLICYSANYLQPKGSVTKHEGKDSKTKRRRKREKDSGSHKDRQAGSNPPSRTSGDGSAGSATKSNSAGGSADESDLTDAEVGTPVDSSARHRQWGAVCLETVNYIGSLRFKQLPSMVLHPGQQYYHKTVHKFSTTGAPQKRDSESTRPGEQEEQAARKPASSETSDKAEAMHHKEPHETAPPRSDGRTAGAEPGRQSKL